MVTIFVCHAREDDIYAEEIRKQLERQGYRTWRELQSLDLYSLQYPPTIEHEILKSVAMVLLWSRSAEQSQVITQQALFAQSLKKLLLVIVLDGTSLPNVLIANTIISSQLPPTDVITQLMPHLPAPNSTDPLI